MNAILFLPANPHKSCTLFIEGMMPRLVCTCQLRAQTWGSLETSSRLRCRGPCSEWSLALRTPASRRRSTFSFQIRSSWRSQSRPEKKKGFVSVGQMKSRQSHPHLFQIMSVLMFNSNGSVWNGVIISVWQYSLDALTRWIESGEQLVAALPKVTSWCLQPERREWRHPKKHRTRLNLNYTFLYTVITLLCTANMRQVNTFHLILLR